MKSYFLSLCKMKEITDRSTQFCFVKQKTRKKERTNSFIIIILAQLSFFESRIDKRTLLTDCVGICFSSRQKRRKRKRKKRMKEIIELEHSHSNRTVTTRSEKTQEWTMDSEQTVLLFDLSTIRFWFCSAKPTQPPVHKRQYDPREVWDFENGWNTTLCSCKPRKRCKSQSPSYDEFSTRLPGRF